MTPQEHQLLQDFLNQLTQVRGVPKDPEADALIAKAVAAQPDATYLLVQRAMLLEQALNNAKTQIAQFQNQASANVGGGSFLSSAGWGKPQPASSATPFPSAAAPQSSSPGFLAGGGGSFLSNVAATAAGVVGGAFLFQGIESLLGHHGSGFLGQGLSSRDAVENVTVNNYYGDDQQSASAEDTGDDSLLGSGFDDNGDDGDSSLV
jgi:hypothetical protein